MAEFKIGEASWDEEDVALQRPSDRKKIPFLQMNHDKAYRVRIVSKPYRYYYKWITNANGKQTKLNSSLTEDCPLNADGKEPQVGWYAKALYRDGDKTLPVVIDFGKQILKAIKQIQANPDYGPNIHTYDITISKGKKGTQPLYTVLPSPPKPFTDAEKTIALLMNKAKIDDKDNPEYIDLDDRCKPLTVDVIRKILAGGAKPAAGSAAPDEAGVFGEEPAPTPTPTPAAKSTPEVKAASQTVAAKPAVTAQASAPKTEKKADTDFLDF